MTLIAYLTKGVGEVLLSTQHVGDLHGGVVNCHAEVVDRLPVGAQDDEVTQGVGVPRHLPSHRVVDGDLLVLPSHVHNNT